MQNKKGIFHFLPIVIVAVVLSGLVLLASTGYRGNGYQGSVLHDSDEREEVDNSGSGSQESDLEESETRDSDDSLDATDSPDSEDGGEADELDETDELDDSPRVGVRLRAERDDDDEEDDERLEVRFSETERLRVRTKRGERRIDVYQGGVKVRFEYKDGRFIAKAEYEGQEEGVEIEEEDIFKLVDSLDDDEIRISTQSGRLALTRGSANAVTDFPLSIDLDTNSLIVTTPAGEKIVAVLPDQAIENMIAANTLSDVENKGEIELEDVEGEPVYDIQGVSRQRLLGLLPIGIQRRVKVSAETGQALQISQGLISRVLDAISF